MRRSALLIAFIALCGLLAAAQGVTPIGNLYGLPYGTIVTVEGFVTVPSALFFTSTRENGFALQDVSGGIYVWSDRDLELELHQNVRVTGELGQFYGMRVLTPITNGVGLLRPSVPPLLITTTEAAQGLRAGSLVSVTGTLMDVQADPPYGVRLFVDDGTGEVQVYVASSTNIDLTQLLPGQIITFVGFNGFYQDHFEVNPRFASDIILRTTAENP